MTGPTRGYPGPVGGGTGTAAGRLSTSASHAFPSLTGARFVAALLVFGSHLHQRFPLPPLEHLAWTERSAASAVTFFFVLSGFVLTLSWRDGEPAAPFWQRRLARVGPIYLVTGALTVAWFSVIGEPPRLGALVVLATATQAWFYRPEYALNVPAWSLSCEVAFYLVFPAIMVVRSAFRTPWARWALLICVLVAHQWASLRVRSTFPPFAGLAFLAGVLLAHEPVSDRAPRWLAPSAVVAFVLGQVALAGGPRGLGGTAEAVGLATTAALVWALAARDASAPGGVLQRFATLGLISYAFYMVHYLVIRVTAKGLRILSPDYAAHPVQVAEAAVVALVVSLGAAWALYHGVERPLEQRFRGARTRLEVAEVEPHAS
jgi:peptidoglycan/LPS O-acetylase OafA/YrhL